MLKISCLRSGSWFSSWPADLLWHPQQLMTRLLVTPHGGLWFRAWKLWVMFLNTMVPLRLASTDLVTTLGKLFLLTVGLAMRQTYQYLYATPPQAGRGASAQIPLDSMAVQDYLRFPIGWHVEAYAFDYLCLTSWHWRICGAIRTASWQSCRRNAPPNGTLERQVGLCVVGMERTFVA